MTIQKRPKQLAPLCGHAKIPEPDSDFDSSLVPAFAIDNNHVVTRWNKACENITGTPAASMIGTKNQWTPFYDSPRPVLADLVVDGSQDDEINFHYPNNARRSLLMPGAFDAEGFFPGLNSGKKWIFFSASPLRDASGNVIGAIETLQDVTKQKAEQEEESRKIHSDLELLVTQRTAELMRRNAELTEVNERLSSIQQQLIQSDKLASIGQLAAGVAHEINNPIGYIFSNFGTLETYLASLMDMLEAYEKAEPMLANAALRDELKALREQIELDYLKEDIPVMMRESMEGIGRVREIVQDLKDFSRTDNFLEWQWSNLHLGIDSTLNIVSNEVKYKADVVRIYGDLPEVECLPTQINQVIMNLVINAVQSIGATRGTITIRTGCDASQVWIHVADNGCGISSEHMTRIFDPFYTTKPIGMGTGLGLSMAYGIISKHNGRIDVDSTVGVGSTFRITLPIRQQEARHG